jgi:hypothetical protein
VTTFTPTGGGSQIKKSVQAGKAWKEGMSYKVNNDGEKEMRFPVYTQTLLDKVNIGKSLLFGPYSLPTAQDYVDSNFKGYNADDTKRYTDLRDSGASQRSSFELVDKIKGIKGSDRKEKVANEIIESDFLSSDQKQKLFNSYYKNKEGIDVTSKESYEVSTLPASYRKAWTSNKELQNTAGSVDKIKSVIDVLESNNPLYKSKENKIKKISSVLGVGKDQAQEVYFALKSQKYDIYDLEKNAQQFYMQYKNAFESADDFVVIDNLYRYSNQYGGTNKKADFIARMVEKGFTRDLALRFWNSRKKWKAE